MQIEGTYTFAAPLEAVWGALMDPAVLAQALPGGEEMVKVGDNEYQAVMNVRVGPVQGRFEGRIELSDIVERKSYQMKVSGQGSPGFVSGTGRLALQPNGDDNVLLAYSGDVQIGGKIAGISQRLVESSAKSLTRQGLQALDRQIQATLAPAPVAAAPAAVAEVPAAPLPPPSAPGRVPAEQPSAASVAVNVARDVARDLAGDYLTPSRQDKAFWAALGALGMLLFVVLVRLVQKR